MTTKIIYLIVINILSFLLMGWDKYKAINNHNKFEFNCLKKAFLLL